jgi:Flp pilus assembly pilin Flp
MNLSTMALRALASFQARVSRTGDESGQTLAEYSLIISAIAVAAVVTAVIVFRTVLAETYNTVTECLNGTSC